MIQRTAILSALMALVPGVSSAAPIPRFTDYLEMQVSSAEKAMSSKDSANRAPEFELYQFYLKIAPEVAFDIPEIAEVQIAPEIGLIWEKLEAPEGPPPSE